MAVPIITCGDSQPDATGVRAAMRPEYEVIYAGYSLPETLAELPQLLAKNSLPASALHTQVASNSFARRPVAIVFGGGYDDKAYNDLYQACLSACGGSKQNLGVAFFRADNELTDKLFAEGQGPQKRTKGYPEAITRRLKYRLKATGVENGLKEEDIGELFWF